VKRKRGAFLELRRQNEIEAHAKYVGAADTDDFDRWLIAWIWHNGKSRDPIRAIRDAALRMGFPGLAEAKARALLTEADDTPRRCKADSLARYLGITYAQRQFIGITTIGSCDVSRHERRRRRKERDRMMHDQHRRARGARPRAAYEATSLSRTKPWEAQGISRRTWERRRRDASPSAAIPPLKAGSSGDASPSAAIFLNPADTPASPDGKQRGFRGGVCLNGTEKKTTTGDGGEKVAADTPASPAHDRHSREALMSYVAGVIKEQLDELDRRRAAARRASG
jgi:hypothetical protein